MARREVRSVGSVGVGDAVDGKANGVGKGQSAGRGGGNTWGAEAKATAL